MYPAVRKQGQIHHDNNVDPSPRLLPHVQWIERSKAARVRGRRVAPMGLIDPHLPALAHVMEVLLGVRVGSGGDP
jgi:hypothetical protein